jgi:cytochrome c-type biogenesis protein CcmH
LLLEPDNPKALLYAGFAALGRGETASARERFSRMLTLNPPPQIREIIEKQLSALDGATATPAMPAGAGAKVAVHVTLAPALAGKVPAGATLFVAARDPKAPGPPFAVKRLPAEFPIDVELSAADAMLESRRIAAGQQLEVVARVALGGTPTATTGDPFGQVSYHVGKDGRLNIVIDRLAP